MKERAVVNQILSEFDEGTLVYFRPPNADATMACSRSMLDSTMLSFSSMGRSARRGIMRSVARCLAESGPLMETGKATQKQADDFAADCAIWLAHELMFSDGQKHLVKAPNRNAMEEMLKMKAPN
jgi:hypothetical protein